MRFSYTPNATEGIKYAEVENLTLSEIAKLIRQDLKKELPGCKFSVQSKLYSGGGSIDVYLMRAPQNIYSNEYEQAKAIDDWEQIRQLRKEDKEYTDFGKNILAKAKSIWDSYNFDDSDSMIDYFHVNYYGGINIGKWDKPFQVS